MEAFRRLPQAQYTDCPWLKSSSKCCWFHINLNSCKIFTKLDLTKGFYGTSDQKKMPIWPTKSAHLTYNNIHIYKNCPSDLHKLPIRPTKSAHQTYEKCPSDLWKMPIRPTKNAHRTYEKCSSDLWKLPICPTKNAHPPYEKGPSDHILTCPRDSL